MAQLIEAETGIVAIENLEVADRFWPRFVGLQFRRSMPDAAGILLSPCSSIHTCFMRFPIDVIMLNKDNEVLDIRRNVSPWRIVLCDRGTVKLVETNVGLLDIEKGKRLVVTDE